MKSYSKIASSIILVLLLFGGTTIYATHIVGGYLSYECLGINANGQASYLIRMQLYRDCRFGNPAAREPTVPVSFFRSGIIRDQTVRLSPISRDTLPDDVNNPCVVESPDICVEEEIYEGLVNVNPNFDFVIAFQRCCRNGSISNLVDPGDQGSTFTTQIPAFNRVGCNSTPIFNSDPPIILCSNFDFNLDLSASDADGDSLVYSLCSPFNFPTSNTPFPNQANAPPYLPIIFSSPFSSTFPIPSNPAVTMNSRTGRLNGVPTSLGQYVMGFCVEEYRNGTLINTIQREIQINNANCSPVVTTAVQEQEQFCDGLTVQFRNRTTANININNYKWDFGVIGSLNDTSRAFEPVFTFPDTGIYTITLISNPGFACSDTSQEEFKVYPVLEPRIDFDGKACKDENNFTFLAKGIFEDYANIQWNFGSSANQLIANRDSVPNIRFTGNGPFPVQLIVSQDGCSDTLSNQVELFENPQINFAYTPEAGCYPLEVSFTNLSTFEGAAQFLWEFGDGNLSSQQDAFHVYRSNGYFDVALELITTEKCKDTLSLKIDSAIHTSLDSSTNQIAFGFEAKEGCLPLLVQFSDSSIYEGNANYLWEFGDGNVSNQQNPSHLYQDTGLFNVSLRLNPNTKCIDTLYDTLTNAIQVYPKPFSFITTSDNSLPLKEANFRFDGRVSADYTSSRFEVDNAILDDSIVVFYTFKDTGHFIVNHIVQNQFGCEDTSYVRVLVFDEFEFIIPNVFTPNGDGINDVFQPKACGVYAYHVRILNRFGELVFQSNSLGIPWDGTVQGRPANEGVFFYHIVIKDFRGKFLNYTGTVSLLKN